MTNLRVANTHAHLIDYEVWQKKCHADKEIEDTHMRECVVILFAAVPLLALWFVLAFSAPSCACDRREWSVYARTHPPPFAFAQRDLATGMGTFAASGRWRHRRLARDCVTTGPWSAWSEEAELTLASGHHEIEFVTMTGTSMTVPVSVGDILFTAGQSNSVYIGTWSRSACALTHDQFWLGGWRRGHRECASGMLGDVLVDHDAPIAFVTTGVGGMPIAEWSPGGFPRSILMDNLRVHRPRAVLWHQGESDTATPTNVYEERLTKLVLDAQRVWNATWIVAQVIPKTIPAQRAVAQALSNVYHGPDTLRVLRQPGNVEADGVHFSCAGIAANARLWKEALRSAGVTHTKLL